MNHSPAEANDRHYDVTSSLGLLFTMTIFFRGTNQFCIITTILPALEFQCIRFVLLLYRRRRCEVVTNKNNWNL